MLDMRKSRPCERGVPDVRQTKEADRELGKIPVIRSSICTGEQVAGFKDSVSGKFDELMLIRDNKDLSEFLSRYQVEESEIKREW